jgi:hypothetical protein
MTIGDRVRVTANADVGEATIVGRWGENWLLQFDGFRYMALDDSEHTWGMAFGVPEHQLEKIDDTDPR